MVEPSLEDKDPIQFESGDLGCPDCHTPLVKGSVKRFLKGIFLGAFEGLLCPMCRYGLLSEKGYEDSAKVAQDMGIIQQILQIDKDGSLHWVTVNPPSLSDPKQCITEDFLRFYQRTPEPPLWKTISLTNFSHNDHKSHSKYGENEIEKELTQHMVNHITKPPMIRL